MRSKRRSSVALSAPSSSAQAEIGHHQAQQVVAGHLRGDDARHDVGAAVELRPELLDQRRLAGADLAGDDDEAFLLRQPVDQMRDRAAVAAGAEEEPAVGGQLERDAGEVVKFLVHGAASKLLGDSDQDQVLIVALTQPRRNAVKERIGQGGRQCLADQILCADADRPRSLIATVVYAAGYAVGQVAGAVGGDAIAGQVVADLMRPGYEYRSRLIGRAHRRGRNVERDPDTGRRLGDRRRLGNLQPDGKEVAIDTVLTLAVKALIRYRPA